MDRHQWCYRNPYSRRCKTCGKREDMYANNGHLEWETVYPLVDNPCGPLTTWEVVWQVLSRALFLIAFVGIIDWLGFLILEKITG